MKKYTEENFKETGKDRISDLRKFMIVEEDGIIESDRGNVHVKKGEVIIQHKDGRIWPVDKKIFDNSYKLDEVVTNKKIKFVTKQDHDLRVARTDIQANDYLAPILNQDLLVEFNKVAEENGWHCGTCKLDAMMQNYLIWCETEDPSKFKFVSN